MPDSTAAVRSALLAWFRKQARLLPWRKTPSPYKTWISEVMLQQTQVATVVPYYVRFISAFPSVDHLAAAPLERVLKLWSGLGYYRRARHLHSAARRMVGEFGGQFPQSYEKARSLPGVGDYTARAILSIAYNQPHAAVDGNVARVISRLAAIRGSVDQGKFRAAVRSESERLLSRRRPGNFNQAIMELGQTICLPRAPHCSRCPVVTWCQAHRYGAPHQYPRPRRRRATEVRYLAAAVIRPVRLPGGSHRAATGRSQAETRIQMKGADGNQQVALVRGLDEGLVTDLWNFPSAFGNSRREAFERLREKLTTAAPFPVRWSRASSDNQHQPLLRLHHGITHRSIQVDVYGAEAMASSGKNRIVRWSSLYRLENAAVSQLTRKVANLLLEHRGAHVSKPTRTAARAFVDCG